MADGGPKPRTPWPFAGARGNTHAGTQARTCQTVLGLLGEQCAEGWGPERGGCREGRVELGRSEVSEPASPGAREHGAARPPGPSRRQASCAPARWCSAGCGEALAPLDLLAAAVRAERFVFAAAPLTAAITLQPQRNPRGAERWANQWLLEKQTPGLAASRALEDGARPWVPGQRREGRLDPQRDSCP